MADPHHKVELKMAAVKDNERVLHPTLDTAGLEDLLVVQIIFESIFSLYSAQLTSKLIFFYQVDGTNHCQQYLFSFSLNLI